MYMQIIHHLPLIFQCQPSWTHLQCVVSRGDDLLPAEVTIKCNDENPDDFLYINCQDWYHNELPKKVYKDPIQEGVRRILRRSMVRAFALFKYEKDELVDVYGSTLGASHESKITEVINIV